MRVKRKQAEMAASMVLMYAVLCCILSAAGVVVYKFVVPLLH